MRDAALRDDEGYLKLHAADEGASQSEVEDDVEEDGVIEECVKSTFFQNLVASVITLNTVLMAIQTDSNPDAWYWDPIDHLLLAFFASELVLRLWTFKGSFFTDADERCWNIFDFIIVVVGVTDWIIKALTTGNKSKASKFVMLLRAIRILRILRVLRLVKAFQQLRLLILGLVSSLKSVFWISILFVLVILVSAIFCTMMIGHDADTFSDPEKVRQAFGTVGKSMVTLFQFVTLDDWSFVARIVAEQEPLMMIFFMVYILITSFTILSLLTGVVSDRILAVTREDQSTEDAEREESAHVFVQECKRLFHQADVDHHKMITKAEFEEVLQDKHAQAKLLHLNIEIDESEIRELFDLIDPTNSGEITKYQFRHGLSRMKGPVQAKDLLKLRMDLDRVERQLDDLGDPRNNFAQGAHRRLDTLITEATSLEGRVDSLMSKFTLVSRGMQAEEDGLQVSRHHHGGF